jgi:hypothetical protein
MGGLMSIDPKAAAGTLGAAIAGLGWFLLAKFDVGGIGDWSTEDIVTATGFSTVILTFVLAYLIPNEASAERAAVRKQG